MLRKKNGLINSKATCFLRLMMLMELKIICVFGDKNNERLNETLKGLYTENKTARELKDTVDWKKY